MIRGNFGDYHLTFALSNTATLHTRIFFDRGVQEEGIRTVAVEILFYNRVSLLLNVEVLEDLIFCVSALIAALKDIY